MNGLIYLASPYSHEDADVREGRFNAAVEAVAALIQEGRHVYSPIVHMHPVKMQHDLPSGWEYWQSFDELILSRCDCIAVLTIPDWDTSVGVKAEIQIAERLKLPLHFIQVWDCKVEILESFEVPVK